MITPLQRSAMSDLFATQAGRLVAMYLGSKTLKWALNAATLLALAACSDLTGSRDTLDVTIAVVSTGGPTFRTGADEQRLVACQLNLSLTASGKANATWENAIFRFYVGKDRTTAADTSVIPGADLAQGWGAEITPGETKQSTWEVSGAFPFGGEIDFRYRPASGKVKTAVVKFECAPAGAANAAPPTITSLTVQPASGELQAGTPLNVSFNVAAPAGVWQFTLSASGPCTYQRVTGGQLETTLTQTLVVQLPFANCQFNTPLKITLGVVDAALQITSKTLTTSLVIKDDQPPTVTPLFFSPGDVAATTTLSGDFFGGDSIQFMPNPADNYRVAAVIWEVLPYGTKDSVVVAPNEVPYFLFAHLKPEWSGPIQLRVYARDASGLTSNVVTTSPNAVMVHPMIDRPTRTTTVSGETRDIAINPKRGVIYLRQGNDHRIAVLSMSTLQVTATVPLPAVPMDFDLTPSGDSLLVLLYGQPQIDVIDLTQPTMPLTTIPLTVDAASSQTPFAVRVGSNGKAYVTFGASTPAAHTLAEVNLATHAQQTRPDAGVGGNTDIGNLWASLDRSVLMLSAGRTCLQRFSIAANSFSGCFEPVAQGGLSMDATGGHFALGLDIYDASMQLLPKAPGHLVVFGVPQTLLSANGDVLFVLLPKFGFVRLRTSDSVILDRTPNPVTPSLIRMSPDGNTLVSVESNYGTTTKISLIDLR